MISGCFPVERAGFLECMKLKTEKNNYELIQNVVNFHSSAETFASGSSGFFTSQVNGSVLIT